MAFTQPGKAFYSLGKMIAFSCPSLPGLQSSHPAISFSRGVVKGLVYVPPLPKDVDELKAQITEAATTIDNAMLERIWQELDYRLDVCRVTNSAHIDHL